MNQIDVDVVPAAKQSGKEEDIMCTPSGLASEGGTRWTVRRFRWGRQWLCTHPEAEFENDQSSSA
jgi:hypothetical protein